jgi:multidrug efflux system membrane fusion protein
MNSSIRRLSLICVTAGAAMLVSGAGCEKAPARTEPPPPKVSVANPQVRQTIDYDEYNGWIDAVETVEVRARVRGHIDKVHFTDGQFVKTGDLLFELDPRPFQAEIGRQRDQAAIIQAQLVAAQKEEARLKELLGRGGASQSQVDKAEADALSLVAQLKANEQEIKRKELDLEYSRITAPINGRISRAMLTTGNLVNAGGSDPVLTTIVTVDPSYIYFSVDERALQRWQKQRRGEGQPTEPSTLKDSQVKIKFAMETDEGYPYEATLNYANNQVDRTTGTIIVRAVVSDPTGRLIAGSRVRIRVPTSAEKTVMLVPDTAILTDQDKKYLLVLDEKNVVQRRDVNPGRLMDDGMRVILPDASGTQSVTSDAWIIVIGIQMARINYPVDPVKPTTQPARTVSSGQ